jgi:hypothetical protein
MKRFGVAMPLSIVGSGASSGSGTVTFSGTNISANFLQKQERI